MANVILSTKFDGLNRGTAPHMLEQSESPAATDFNNENAAGILAARQGRKRLASFNSRITGVVPFKISNGAGRVVGLGGTWHPLSTWTFVNAPPPPPIADQYDITIAASMSITTTPGDLVSTTWAINPRAGATAIGLTSCNVILNGLNNTGSDFLALEGFDSVSGTWKQLIFFFSYSTFPSEKTEVYPVFASGSPVFTFMRVRLHKDQANIGTLQATGPITISMQFIQGTPGVTG